METKKRRRMEIFQQRTTEARNRRPIKQQPDGEINKMHTGKNNLQNTNKNQQTKPGKRNRNNKSPEKGPEGEKKRIQHCNKEKQKQTWKPGQTKGRNRKRTQREHKRPSQKNQQGRRNKITIFLERKKENNTQSSNSYITLNESGHPIEDPAEAKEHISQYFENLYQAREGRPQYAQWTKEIKTTLKRITESDGMKEDIDPILTTEITEAIHKLKNGKATGPDEIPNEIFTKAEPQTIEVYRKALQTIADNRDIPERWQKGQIIRPYKGKGKRGKCSNERGITLASNFGKLFERILNNRAKEKINITENQPGGQKG